MLFSLLVRLAMVAVTMAVVCWIGWTIPESRDATALQAEEPPESDRVPVGLVPSTTSRTPLVPPSRRQGQEFSRKSAPTILDVNLATEQEFERLPGIGPVLARRIVQYRETQGSFQDVQQLRHVKGIGEKTFERIRGFVAVVPPAIAKPVRKTA